MKISWSDGHNLGIYTFEYPRSSARATNAKS